MSYMTVRDNAIWAQAYRRRSGVWSSAYWRCPRTRRSCSLVEGTPVRFVKMRDGRTGGRRRDCALRIPEAQALLGRDSGASRRAGRGPLRAATGETRTSRRSRRCCRSGTARRTPRPMIDCDRWDVVTALFPFTDAPVSKPRPVLVLSNAAFNRAHAHVIGCMITTGARSRWPSDHAIRDLARPASRMRPWSAGRSSRLPASLRRPEDRRYCRSLTGRRMETAVAEDLASEPSASPEGPSGMRGVGAEVPVAKRQ